SAMRGASIHQAAGELLAFAHDATAPHLECIAADHGAARAVSAAPDRHLGGVALHVANVFERNAEPFMHELGEHGGVSLAVRMRSAEDGQRSAGIEAQLHAFVEDAAELDVVAHRAAAQLAVLLRSLLAPRIALPV